MTRNLVVCCDGAGREPAALRRHVCAATVPVLLLLAGSAAWVHAAMGADDWLRGAGKDLEIRLKGEVFERDGRAAIDPKVVGVRTPRSWT